MPENIFLPEPLVVLVVQAVPALGADYPNEDLLLGWYSAGTEPECLQECVGVAVISQELWQEH